VLSSYQFNKAAKEYESEMTNICWRLQHCDSSQSGQRGGCRKSSTNAVNGEITIASNPQHQTIPEDGSGDQQRRSSLGLTRNNHSFSTMNFKASTIRTKSHDNDQNKGYGRSKNSASFSYDQHQMPKSFTSGRQTSSLTKMNTLGQTYNATSNKNHVKYRYGSEKIKRRAQRICKPAATKSLFPRTDLVRISEIDNMLYEFRQFGVRYQFFTELCTCLHARELSQENVSCLNTGIVILTILWKENNLDCLLEKLRDQDIQFQPEDWSFSIKYILAKSRNTAMNNTNTSNYPDEPVPLVLNMIQLLTFWKNHYFLKIKKADDITLVQTTNFSMDEWSTVIEICLEKLWAMAESTPCISRCLAKLPKYWYDVYRPFLVKRKFSKMQRKVLKVAISECDNSEMREILDDYTTSTGSNSSRSDNEELNFTVIDDNEEEYISMEIN